MTTHSVLRHQGYKNTASRESRVRITRGSPEPRVVAEEAWLIRMKANRRVVVAMDNARSWIACTRAMLCSPPRRSRDPAEKQSEPTNLHNGSQSPDQESIVGIGDVQPSH